MGNIKIWLFIFGSMLACNKYSYCQKYYEEAIKEYFYGDLKKSIGLFTSSIDNNQEVSKSYMYRGAAESFLRNFPDALIDLNSSFKLDSVNDKIYYYYGKYYLLNELYGLAIRYYNKSISKNPKNAAAYDERAVTKGMLNDFKGAIEDEDQAIKLDPSKQIYYTDRGFAKSALEQYAEAIKDYDISLKIEPNHKAYANRGFAYSVLGQYQKAIDDYTNALVLFGKDYEIYYRRGISYKAIGKINEACTDFARSAELGYSPALAEQKNSCK